MQTAARANKPMKNNKYQAELTFNPDVLSIKIACDPTSREEMTEKLAGLMESFTRREGPFPCTFTDNDGNILYSSKN